MSDKESSITPRRVSGAIDAYFATHGAAAIIADVETSNAGNTFQGRPVQSLSARATDLSWRLLLSAESKDEDPRDAARSAASLFRDLDLSAAYLDGTNETGPSYETKRMLVCQRPEAGPAVLPRIVASEVYGTKRAIALEIASSVDSVESSSFRELSQYFSHLALVLEEAAL